jgi:hypothetical protein
MFVTNVPCAHEAETGVEPLSLYYFTVLHNSASRAQGTVWTLALCSIAPMVGAPGNQRGPLARKRGTGAPGIERGAPRLGAV